MFRSIPVTNWNSDRLTVYEFHDRRFIRKVRRATLCSGELVERLEDDTFAVVGTGEKLLRIDAA